MEQPSPQTLPPNRSTWLGAFAHPAFAVVWTASTIALIGIAMYDTASGWLMTTLDLNPFDVSLVHAATNLPMFLFTLPAGAIADIVDPRRLIVAVSCAIAAMIAIFAGLVSFDLATPVLLLLTTFLLSAAWALNLPAGLSILPDLVPKSDLPEAMAANGVAYNLSRTLGPALGGFAIVNFGISTPFWAFVAANLGVIAALLWWRAPRKETASLPAERLNSAVRVGLRHAVNNRLLRATLARSFAFFPFAAAYWGLLPLIARQTGEGAEHYGVLLSAISAGSIFGSFGQRFLRDRISLDWMVVLGTVGTAAALGLFGWSREFAVVLAACFCAGAAWVVILTSLYVSAQNVLPDWVRGRGLAIFLTVVFGAMTVSSAAWGQIAGRIGVDAALLVAAAAILAVIPVSWPWKLQQSQPVDLSPSLHWRRPQSAQDIADDRGPVLVKIEYWIDPKDRERFLRAIDELGQERKRDGAFAWGIFEDMGEFGRFEEGYLIESWLELMHLRERVTNEDRMLEDEISEMLIKPPHIEFLVAADRQPLRHKSRDAPTGG
jgi:MFS family permease